jgi:hypothetical protein
VVRDGTAGLRGVRRRCLHGARAEGRTEGSAASPGSKERGLATLGAPPLGVQLAVATRPAERRGVGLFTRYQRCLETRPILTKVLTSGVLSGFGAVAADIVTNPRNPAIDVRRAARFALAGAFVTAPACHVWWGFLGRRFGAGGFRNGVVKTALDTALFAPPWQLCFIVGVYALEAAPLVGTSASQQLEVGTPLERTLPMMPGVMKDYVFIWVPVQLINFTFVPVPFQVLCVTQPAALDPCALSPPAVLVMRLTAVGAARADLRTARVYFGTATSPARLTTLSQPVGLRSNFGPSRCLMKPPRSTRTHVID